MQNDEENKLTPTLIDSDRFEGGNVGFVAAGAHHAMAITSSGDLYTWGDCSFGQLGLSTRSANAQVSNR